MERKLAAILAADVAGNSRLMRRDEDSTLDALRSHREVVRGFLATRRGRVFNRVGEATGRVTEIPQDINERSDSARADRVPHQPRDRDVAGRERRP